ncbi:hypothetical protein [Kiloniella majae]|uniref:hypothetical protein n=1 Tax=Kiloniella majae TaxID=1938558 RepID=UPI000A276E88|nr:hypothetical protein [Kiloniella majae]
MIINRDNCEIGNKAMSWVLLLYYHLIIENGFTNDQNVYIDPDEFNGYDFLDVKVDDDLEIDQSLIREGAIIYLLCDLTDQIIDYEEDFIHHPLAKKVIEAYENQRLSAIPETLELFTYLNVSDGNINYEAYRKCLSRIYDCYVLSRFKQLVQKS